MSKSRNPAPWDFLLSASRNTLQSYELSRLAHASNLRKEITALLDQWLEEHTAANLARCLMEQRERSPLSPDADTSGAEAASSNNRSASDNFLADRLVSPLTSRTRS